VDSTTTGLAAIPDNGLLLHVGVFKTGTTALQEALRAAGPALTEAGVLYRGPASWVPRWKSLLVLVAENKPGGQWQQMVAAVNGHEGRAMVSSENLCGATPREAATVVGKLGAGRPVKVLITVRSLSGLLASTWQQLLKRGLTLPFEDWLHKTFDNVESVEELFWRRNNFPWQVSKWGELVGEENVILAVSDKKFPTRNLEIVEQLLGVAPGTVTLNPDTRSNRSMSFAEAELLRRLNLQVGEKLRRESYRRMVRLGAFPGFYRLDTGPGEPIPVPRWAAERAADLGSRQAAELRQMSAVIVGDIDVLGDAKWDIDGPIASPEMVSMDTAVAASAGALLAAERYLRSAQKSVAAEPPPPTSARSTERRLRSLLKRS